MGWRVGALRKLVHWTFCWLPSCWTPKMIISVAFHLGDSVRK